MARAKCYCGCGQAPASSCRQRLLTCQCGARVRMSREWLERVQLTCSCGSILEPVCLEDRARAGDESAWTEIKGRLQTSEANSYAGKRSAAVKRARAATRELGHEAAARAAGAAGMIGAPTREVFAAYDAETEAPF